MRRAIAICSTPEDFSWHTSNLIAFPFATFALQVQVGAQVVEQVRVLELELWGKKIVFFFIFLFGCVRSSCFGTEAVEKSSCFLVQVGELIRVLELILLSKFVF